MRLAVLFEGEVPFAEIADEVAVFVANGGEEIDGGNIECDGRGLPAEERKSDEKKKDKKFENFLMHGKTTGAGVTRVLLGSIPRRKRKSSPGEGRRKE